MKENSSFAINVNYSLEALVFWTEIYSGEIAGVRDLLDIGIAFIFGGPITVRVVVLQNMTG